MDPLFLKMVFLAAVAGLIAARRLRLRRARESQPPDSTAAPPAPATGDGLQYSTVLRTIGPHRWRILVLANPGTLPVCQIRARVGNAPRPALPIVSLYAVGVPAFDAGFELRFPFDGARTVPVPLDAWHRFARLAEACGDEPPLLEVQEKRILLYLPAAPALDSALQFLSTLLGKSVPPEKVEGLTLLDSPPPAAEGAGMCQVCGETMTDAWVVCVLCRTPHHRECWEYHGSCSTFGCPSRDFVAGDRTGKR